MLRCEARAFPVCTAYGYTISRPFFYSAENAHAYESGHVASGGETFIAASSIIGHLPLAVNMPPTKVCLQCKAAVPVRRKTCERCDHVFRSKRKAECNLREKAMKRMRAVESESLKNQHDYQLRFVVSLILHICRWMSSLVACLWQKCQECSQIVLLKRETS